MLTPYHGQTLNLILTQDATHRTNDSFRLHILTDASEASLDSVQTSSKPPMQAFESPFTGWSLHQVNEFFRKHVGPRDAFTHNVFIVLDKYSDPDETCTVVEAREMTEDDSEGLATLRTDFYVARQVATPAEMGLEGLLENRDYQKVYTRDEVPLQL